MSTTPSVDPRGQRFAAVLTTVVLVGVLVTGSGWLLALQALVFGIGAFAGLRYAPYGLLYRHLVRPRLGPPSELEAEDPPRFAQGVGFAFAVVGAAGYLSGATLVGVIATAFALGAAFLNAAFGFCLGCEMYLLIRRIPLRRLAAATRQNPIHDEVIDQVDGAPDKGHLDKGSQSRRR